MTPGVGRKGLRCRTSMRRCRNGCRAPEAQRDQAKREAEYFAAMADTIA